MTSAEELSFTTFEDFLAREKTSERRHELVGGRVYVMTGGIERHALATGLVYRALAPEALTAGCRPFASDRMVRTPAAAYYPDIVVVCGRASHPHYERDAALIVDVLSPSTTDVDRREKATAYFGLPSLAMYVLVDPERRRIEAARPLGGELSWNAFGPGDVVVTPYGVLDVDGIYDALDTSATT